MKIKKIRLFFIAVFCIFSFAIFSQYKLKFEAIPMEEGLSNKGIPAILQDRQGFLWFATQDGLNKYNGYEFKVFQNDPSDSSTISHNNIFSMIEDSDGFLWLGTENGGLNKFDVHTEKCIRFLHSENDPQSISSNNVYCIYESRAGELWIGTYESGVDVMDKKTGKILRRYKTISGNDNSISKGAVWEIHEDKSGNFWFSTWGGGLDKLDLKTGQFKHFRHDDKNSNTISNNIVGDVYEDENGMFWITTWGGGLNKFDPVKETFVNYFYDKNDPNSIGTNLVWPVKGDGKGNIWIGTYGSGVNKFDPVSQKFTRYANDPEDKSSLNYNDVWSLFFDRSGTMWIGTEGGGISKCVNIKKKVDFYTNDKSAPLSVGHNSVRSVCEDDSGMVWIGTWDGGLDMYNPLTNKIKNYRREVTNGSNTGLNKIRTIYCARDGKLWLGVYRGGLTEFDRKTGVFTYHSCIEKDESTISDNYVLSVYEDRMKNFWVGTLNGLNLYDKQTQKFKRIKKDPQNKNSISNNTVNFIFETKDGSLWMATDYGLNRYDHDKKIFLHYFHDSLNPKSLCHNTVYTLFEDSEGNVWAGTRNGLEKFNVPQGTFEHFTMKDGLPNNMIMSIQENNKNELLISTKKGVSKFNKVTRTFINYDAGDGIHGRLFFPNSSCKTKDGKIYFGSTEGLNAFYPDSIENNKYVPPVHITGIKKFGEEIKFAGPIENEKELVLSYDENSLAFDFVGLNFINALENQYAYKLEGLEKDWQYNGNRRFTSYANLPPGTYVFRVKASNDDGLWNEQGASIKIIIHPPFWKTTWFLVLCVVIAIAFIILFIKSREKKLQKEKRILEEKVTERTAEVIQQKELVEYHIKEMKDSIHYAERIQLAILPSRAEIHKALPESFILFKPRDIVSGDFYWFSERKDKIVIAAADCTGHGVPGAFMSMIGNTLLNQIVNEREFIKPHEILFQLREEIMKSLKQTGASGENKDGMDIALCVFDKNELLMEFAGANNPVYIVKGEELTEIKADKQPVGIYFGEPKPFTTHSIKLEKGDCIYISSDGYADQFGGSQGKKFKYKQLKEFLVSIHTKPMQVQHDVLDKSIVEWRGNLEQVDDILIIGIRV